MRQAERWIFGVLFLGGGLHCLWRALRALLAGRWDSPSAGIPVRHERASAPGRFFLAVAGDVWFGLLGLLLAFWLIRGLAAPYDRLAFGVLVLPVGPLFLWRAIRGFFAARIDYETRGSTTRRFSWARDPGYFLYGFFANLFLGSLAAFFAWRCLR